MKTYCLVYKKHIENNNISKVKNKGGLMIKYNCPVCRNKKFRFILQGRELLDSLGLNTPQNRMKNALWNAFR